MAKQDRERYHSDTRCHKCNRTIMDIEVDEKGIGWFIKLKDVGRSKRKWECQYCRSDEDSQNATASHGQTDNH